MSSSYVVEPQDDDSEKKDSTLIIVVSDDGTISVDQTTLQNLIMNQSNANVSVVRLGPSDTDTENGDITLTVDPPSFMHSTNVVSANINTDPGGLVDPFMEMDPEQLERLETALQSEEAKQILGENVTAMLDMLSVEEQQNTIRYSIQLDHCYTSRLSPSDPIPRDPLPIADDSPNSNDIQYIHQPSSSQTSIMASSIDNIGANVKGKNIVKTGKQMNRPIRKTTVSALTNVSKISTNIIGIPKSEHSISRNITNIHQKIVKEEEDDEITESSIESSESEPPSDNDDDSDFGPRNTKRSNIKSRGGRKGLTTRGGSMVAVRRRGQNKQLDMEQVRRLDMEMAAAVDAMKTPEKDDRIEKFSPIKNKRQIKIFSRKKKEDLLSIETSSSMSEEISGAYEKPLQMTNQVKTNIINANMIKGDMVLTKSGQGKSNQKVIFVQKQIPMKPNELQNIGLKKSVIFSKEKLINHVGTKFFTTKDGKLIQLPMTESKTQPIQGTNQGLPVQQKLKILPSVSGIIKPSDIKREKRKSDTSIESLSKGEESSAKSTDNKILDSVKRSKRDIRKTLGHVADNLGPALFSTPDIIRRVTGNNDGKVADNVGLPISPTASFATVLPTPGSSIVPMPTAISFNIGISVSPKVVQNNASNCSNKKTISTLEQFVQPESQLSLDESNNASLENKNEQKSEIKAPLSEGLQPSLDSAPNTASPEEIIQPVVRPHVVSKNSEFEGQEHLLATLEMEASKHEEELLAEALLLQEELGVDLVENSALVDPMPSVLEPLAPNNILMPTLISSEQELPKAMEITPITQVQTNALKETSKKFSKDDKEPIQIIRGGRVITLPPIEAPATRSKRLQTKIEMPQKNPEPVKKIEKIISQVQQLLPNKAETEVDLNEEEEDDEEDEEDHSDSEDDPNRLWCICKRPHNNRFMICCDVCEDWFHGKCVHVSKAMGQQMEEKGIEWVCPNCLKKKAEEEKTKSNSQLLSGKQKMKIEPVHENLVTQTVLPSKEIFSSNSLVDNSATPITGTMQCVVCKKEARNSSIYCSDACILAHAQETCLTKDKSASTGSNTKSAKPSVIENIKAKHEVKVVVFNRKTGKVLTGADAPTKSNLQAWLKENPAFEVVGANNINTLKIGGKLVTQIQTSGKTTKITQLSPVKVQTIPKMIYTKVAGSKQTVLTSNKKITIISATQANTPSSNKSTQLKQTVISTTSGKNPMILKMPMKNVTSTQLKIQAASSPKQIPVKKQETKLSPSQMKQQTKLAPVKKAETEPIRVNIRKTLTELLSNRIKETKDLKLTDEEIADLAINIELEMYKYFKDTGSKYKAKYRSLVFNIKDIKNLTLFRKIADRSLTPNAVVRLSSDEMASQELAEWREKETKHQLEMIKKNELDLMTQAKSIVVKTHKGEQIIENDGGIDHVDPKTPVQDIVTALNSNDNISSTVDDAKKDNDKEDKLKLQMDIKKLKNIDERRTKEKERDKERDNAKSKGKARRERSRSRHRHSRDRDRSKTRDKSKERKSNRNKESRRSKNREREKDKDRDRNKNRDKVSRKESKERSRQKEKEKYKNIDSHSRNHSESRESKDIDKREEEHKRETEKKKELTPPPTEKSIEDRLWRHIEDEATTNTIDGNDSDISDREPSSTVTIKTPDINEESERDKEQETDKETSIKGNWQTVWRGFVNMVDVAKFFITAQEISGNTKDLMDDLPDTVDVVGRISHETVWDYISKMKRTGSKEILVIRLTAANDEEKIPYITLYSYLNSRSRLGVVGNVSKNIKDFYIMPFSSQSTIPSVLLPLIGPGFEENRPHLLLGIIVRNKKKRLAATPIISTKTAKKESDRSYTPPLINMPKEKISSPPPSSSPILYHKTTTLDSIKDKSMVTQMTLESLNKAHIGMSRNVIDNAAICKIVPELSSKIDLTSSPGKVILDDDGDEPYSPGEMDDDMNKLESTTDNAVGILSSSSKNSMELQRKMDELNRQIEEQKQQIEEQKQQIQSISSSFLDETTPILPGLGLDPSTNDCEEAYSPSDTRSFTPPPPGISKFTQPILDKVSDITIPPNLQEILANVKRQESSKMDSYLPSKPSASFLPATSVSLYQTMERYSSSSSNINQSEKVLLETPKENKSKLSTLSDLDLIRKAEEELAAVAAATAAVSASTLPSVSTPPSSASLAVSSTANLALISPSVGTISDASIPSAQQILSSLSLPLEPVLETNKPYQPSTSDLFKKSFSPEQPKPPGLEDEDFPAFPSTPPMINVSKITAASTSHAKISPKSGIVLNVKQKLSDDGSPSLPAKLPRTKSRWGQKPSE